jgi:hypothetical protein
MKGSLFGRKHEVVGHLRLGERDSSGTYSSNELLLRREDGENVWLVLEEGNYAYKTELHEPPDLDPRGLEEEDCFTWEGREWEVEERSEGACETMDWVEGEFPWIPKVGDANAYMEAECPPHTLIAEWNSLEIEWYRSHYLSPGEISQAFDLQPDAVSRPSGPRPGTPREFRPPPVSPRLKATLILSLVCFALSMAVRMTQSEVVSRTVETRVFLPKRFLQAAEAERKVALSLKKAERLLQVARVEEKQARHLEKLFEQISTKVKMVAPKAGNTLTKLNKRLEGCRKAATRGRQVAGDAWKKAYWAVEATPSTTTSFLLQGQRDHFDQVLVSLVKALESRHQALAGELMVFSGKIPEDWPKVDFPLGSAQPGESFEVRLRVPLQGDWLYLVGEVVEDPGGEVVQRFSETFFHPSLWASRMLRSETFTVPTQGRYLFRLQGVTGLRGSDRLALLRDPGKKVSVELFKGRRSGWVAMAGAMFFMLWGILEGVYWALQYMLYMARCTAQAVWEIF